MKLKFSFFDLLVVIPILLFCAYVFVKNPSSTVETRGIVSEQNVFLNITLESVISDEASGDLSVGDPVIDVESGRIIGYIANFKYSDYDRYHSSLKENASYPNMRTVNITISAEARLTNGIYTVQDTSFAIGADYKLLTPNMAFEGVCISMNEDIDRNEPEGLFTR